MKEKIPKGHESKTLETKTFSSEFIRKKIIEILKTIDAVKNIKEVLLLKVEGFDRISLRVELTAKKWMITTEVEFSGRLINKGNSIVLEDGYSLSATIAENKVKDLLKENVSSIGEKIKEYIEKEEGKKVKKVEIVNGELKVTFDIPKITSSKDTIPKTLEEAKIGEEIKNLSAEEKNLNSAREKYAEEYKRFITDRKKERKGWGKLANAKEYVFGAEIKDLEISPELKALEAEYEKATVKYGNKMFQTKKTELKSSKLSNNEKKDELSRYRQCEIFTRVIIEEQSRLNALKAENLPPKEKNLAKKVLDWYIKQPRWAKLAISTVLGTAIIATVSGGTVVAAGGLATFAGMRATRAVAGSLVGQGATKAYDWLFKEKSTAKRADEEKKLAEIFKEETFDVNSLKQGKKEYAQILEREQKAKRIRLITKALIGIAAGAGTSIGISMEISHLAHSVPGQLPASGKLSVPPETIKAPSANAIVHQGQGIEHPLIKQIENNSKLAQELGFKGDVNDKVALHKFAGGEAHRIAEKMGYVGEGGKEIHITEANKVAFELKVENGHPVVVEKTIDGKIIGTFDKEEGYKFEKNPDNQYEKEVNTTRPKITPQEIEKSKTTLPPKTVPEYATAEDLKIKIEEKIDAGKEKTNFTNTFLGEQHRPYLGYKPVGIGTQVGTGSETFTGSYPGGNQSVIAVEGHEYFRDSSGQYHDAFGKSYFPEITPEENAILQHHPEFTENPLNLSGDKLMQAYNAKLGDMNHLFKNEITGISRLSHMKVDSVLKHASEPNLDPRVKHLSEYVILLKESSGLKPNTGIAFGIGSENTQDYIAKAYQTLAAGKGKMSLEKFQEIIANEKSY